MKPALTRKQIGLYHFADGIKIAGLPKRITGCISPDLTGDINGCEISDDERNAGVDIADLITDHSGENKL